MIPAIPQIGHVERRNTAKGLRACALTTLAFMTIRRTGQPMFDRMTPSQYATCTSPASVNQDRRKLV